MTKVTVLGAGGGIGQPLSLLLKLSPYVSDLSLYDIKLSKGVGTDLSHINTNSNCVGYEMEDISKSLINSNLIIITAGIPRKPGMTRDDLFKINAKIIRNLTMSIGTYAPNSRIIIISNPINSIVPVVVETLKSMNKYKPENIFGVTTLDLLRSETFLTDYLNNAKPTLSKQFDKTTMFKNITVIGGHSANTMIPIILNNNYYNNLIKDSKNYSNLINRIKFGGDEVVKAKDGQGSATLSMAFAGFTFVNEILKNIHCDTTENSVTAFVNISDISNGKEAQHYLGNSTIEYFALPIILKNGKIVKIDLRLLEKLRVDDKRAVGEAVENLRIDIEKGKAFVLGNSKL